MLLRRSPGTMSHLLIISICLSAFCARVFSFPHPPPAHSQGVPYNTRLSLAFADENDHGSSTSGSRSKSSSRSSAIVPAGEEALHSAMMARNIRKLRNNRGLLKEDDETDEATRSIAPRNLLLTKRKKKKKKTTTGWSNIDVKPRIADTIAPPPKSIPIVPAVTKSYVRPKRSNGIDLPYQCTLEALQVYYAQHGDLVMPRRYAVPEDDAYPRAWHGVDLASTVYDMKWWQQHVKQKPERVEELNKMGFLWERLQPEWNLVLEALMYYKEIHGNVMVPGKFVVPNDDTRWPKATWGIPLGNCVYRIRHRNDFLRGTTADSRRDQLDGLGFVWNVQEHRFQIFYKALQHFARLEQQQQHAHVPLNTALRVPATFVVPRLDPSWPSDLWGYPLGAKCTAVRQKQLYVKDNLHRQEQLEALNFLCHGGNASLGWLQVMHASAIYSKLHNRQLDVPYGFKVPAAPTYFPNLRVDVQAAADQEDDVWPWPEHLWGLPLGQRLKDVRQKNAYLKGKNGPVRRRQLDALGFNWTPKRGRPRKAG